MFCGSGILLLIAVAYIVRDAQPAERRRRFRRWRGCRCRSSYDSSSADLPDLDSFGSADPIRAAAPPRQAERITVQLAEGETVEVVEVLTCCATSLKAG